MLNCLESESVYYVLVYLFGCRDYFVFGLVPSFVVYCGQDVDEIGRGVLRLYSNLIVEVY